MNEENLQEYKAKCVKERVEANMLIDFLNQQIKNRNSIIEDLNKIIEMKNIIIKEFRND